MTGTLFTDPGALVDDEWANGDDVLTALRGLDTALAQASHALHAGRLTNSPTDPVAWDAGDQATLYLLPFVGNASLNRREDGRYTLSAIPAAGASLDVSAYGSGPYDVFEYDVDGAATLEAEKWALNNERGYELTLDPALGYVKAVDPTRKWRGCVWVISGVISQLPLRQSIYNAFNQRLRGMIKQSTAASWVYTATSAWRLVPNVGPFTVVSPFAAMPARASYNISVTTPGGAPKIAVATGAPGIASTNILVARGTNGVDASLCASGVITLDAGLRTVSAYEFVTATATFVGQTESHLTLLWEC